MSEHHPTSLAAGLKEVLRVPDVTIIVPGDPVPWARAGSNGAQRFTPSHVADFKDRLATHALYAMRGRPPLEGPIRMRILCVFTLPASYHRKRKPPPAEAHVSKPDWDNLGKVTDALSGIVFPDDRWVWDGRVIKIRGGQGERGFMRIDCWADGDLADSPYGLIQ